MTPEETESAAMKLVFGQQRVTRISAEDLPLFIDKYTETCEKIAKQNPKLWVQMNSADRTFKEHHPEYAQYYD